jgi:hypothetical protein
MMQASRARAPRRDKPEHLLYDVKRNPKGRACPPEHMRWPRLVVFLASDDARADQWRRAARVTTACLGMGL